MESAGWSVAVVDARFALPLDADLILGQAAGRQLLVTLEEGALPGGFGSAVLELLADAADASDTVTWPVVRRIGIPAGRFVDHGSVADLRRVLRLDEPGIRAQVEEAIASLGLSPARRPCGRPDRTRRARRPEGWASHGRVGSVSTSCSSSAGWPRHAAAPRR